jgi:hypothetical protein
MTTCRNCKHWGAADEIFSVDKLLRPGWGGHGWNDRDVAVKYIANSRATANCTWGCQLLKEKLDVDIDQGGGWDSGGASVETINTPPDFGCNLFEEYTL